METSIKTIGLDPNKLVRHRDSSGVEKITYPLII